MIFNKTHLDIVLNVHYDGLSKTNAHTIISACMCLLPIQILNLNSNYFKKYETYFLFFINDLLKMSFI